MAPPPPVNHSLLTPPPPVNHSLLTRGVFLVLLQDPEPLVLGVVGHGGPGVPARVVVVLHGAALPLQRGQAGLGRPGPAGRRQFLNWRF